MKQQRCHIFYQPVLAAVLWFLMLMVNAPRTDAQTPQSNSIDSLIDKVSWYGKKTGKPTLFVHFDKTVYTANENVWFTAYLLAKNGGFSRYHTLSVALVKDDDRSIAVANKFFISKGIAFGNMFLPDSIIPGNYSFIVYTNNMVKGKPNEVFIQPVTVKSASESEFNATLFVVDTARKITGSTRKVTLMVNAANSHALPGVSVNYTVGSLLHPLVKGVVKTDKAGLYEFNIPVKQILPGKNTFGVQIKYGGETKTVTVALPCAPLPVTVSFYPEGGNLINNQQSVVGWEVKNTQGTALKVNGILYRDGKPVDTLTTNSFGLGRFKLKPQKGSIYHVKLYGSSQKDTVYILPKALEDGPVINIANALANDTLVMYLRNSTTNNMYIVGHNYQETYFARLLSVGPLSKMVKVVLSDMPKGLAEVTVLDTLGRPLAERLFFAHYNKRPAVSISTDSLEYGTRQKVNLKIKLNDANDNQAIGLVSVACVQDNRLELKKMTDIESYVYLKNELGALPLKENLMGNTPADRQYLEDILLVKGWRRYVWADASHTVARDTTKAFDSPMFTGKLTHFDKNIKKPLMVAVLRDSTMSTVATNDTGRFVLPYNQLITWADKKVTLTMIGVKNNGDYKINLTDPYPKINTTLASEIEPDEFIKATAQTTEATVIKDFQHATHLREVKIKATDDRSIFKTQGMGANECGDYVCQYGILNCPNHHNTPGCHPPVAGQTYITYGHPEVYRGCTPVAADSFFARIDGIYISKEFYPSDYSKQSPTQPEYLSTIYWKHLVKIDAQKELNLTFYTSDITGKFSVIVQGIAGNDVVYKITSFNVMKAGGK